MWKNESEGASNEIQNSRLTRKRVVVALIGLCFGLPSGILLQWPSETRSLSAFHIGELFPTNIYMEAGEASGAPITVHGALDFIPAWISAYIFPVQAHTYATIIAMAACAVIAQIIFILLLTGLVPRSRSFLPFMFVIGLIASQTVHYRDLGLILSIYLFYLSFASRPGRHQNILLLATGAATYIGFLWSWNRGVPGFIALAIAMSVLAISGRRQYWLGLVSMVATSLVLASLFPVFRPQTVLENLSILLKVTESTGYDWAFDGGLSTRIGFLVIYLVSTIAMAIYVVKQPRGAWKYAQATLWGVLLIASIKIAFDRFDWQHQMPSIWVCLSMLIISGPAVAATVNRSQLILSSAAFVGVLWLSIGSSQPLVVLLAALALASLSVSMPITEMTAVWTLLCLFILVTQLGFANSFRLGDPMELLQRFTAGPALTTNQEWLLAQVARQPCLVDLTYRGMISELTHVPSCFRYSTLSWVPTGSQPELIKNLESQSPDVIVWPKGLGTSNTKSSNSFINWIEVQYPYTQCKGDECIRTKLPF